MADTEQAKGLSAQSAFERIANWLETSGGKLSRQQVAGLVEFARMASITISDDFMCASSIDRAFGHERGECDWPFCGCDPYADRVIAAIEESGRISGFDGAALRKAGVTDHD